MQYQKLELGSYGVNCYILFGQNNTATLIDPGADVPAIEDALQGARVTTIILTHGHFDHIYEAPYFRDTYAAKVLIHPGDEAFLQNRHLYAPYGMFSGFPDKMYRVDGFLQPGQTISLSGTDFEIIHTPGHTPGSVSLYGGGHLFCGDLLFRMSIGRTDFPEGDSQLMGKSLDKIMQLDKDTYVHPGHGPDTTIEQEKRQNPYIKRG